MTTTGSTRSSTRGHGPSRHIPTPSSSLRSWLPRSSGYGYVYRKIVRLREGKPEMVLEHRLKNTGSRKIETSVYNHNFLVLDQQPPGPGFVITVPFEIRSSRPPNKELAEIRGNQLAYMKTLEEPRHGGHAPGGFRGQPGGSPDPRGERQGRRGHDHHRRPSAVETVSVVDPNNGIGGAVRCHLRWNRGTSSPGTARTTTTRYQRGRKRLAGAGNHPTDSGVLRQKPAGRPR